MEDLHHWMVQHFSAFPLFQHLADGNPVAMTTTDTAGREEEGDPVLSLLASSTEEGRKVSRVGGLVFTACFKRVADTFQPTRH